VKKSYRIVEDDLTGGAVVELVRLHLDGMHACSPACKVNAMPVERLRGDDVTFYSAWDGERLAAFGAIKHLADDHGELKSMRAAPEYRGKGAGSAILEHLLSVARMRGYRRVSLETGRTAPFADAHALYARNGFVECDAFGDYVADEFSMCMTRTLD